jgi:mannose-1-phosphate guanylyltransferase
VFTRGIGDGTALGLRIDYVNEAAPLGTAGGIRNVVPLLVSRPDEPVVVLNSDVLSSHHIAAQVDAHVAARADVSLHVTEVDDPRAFGCVSTDGSGRVTAFLEKAPEPVTHDVNAGSYVFTRRVIDEIPVGRPVSVEHETFPGLLRAGALVLAYTEPGYWLDVGTLGSFVRGACDLVLGRLASSVLPGPTGESLVLPGARLADSAVLTGGTTAGAGAVIGAGARVEGSVLLDGAVVCDGAVVRGSVLGRESRVGERTVLDGVMVGDRAHVGADNELLAGSRVWADATLPDHSIRFSSDEAST